MNPIIILFMLIAIFIYGLTNYYIGLKGLNSIGKYLPFIRPEIYWIIFWFIVFSFAISRLLSKYLPAKINYFVSIVGYYWIAAFEYFLIIILFYNLIKLLSKYIYPSFYELISRSTFTSKGSLFVITAVIILLIYGTINASNPVIKTYNLNINKLAGNMQKLNIV